MISIVIPVLNEERCLPRCLAAVVPQARVAGAELLVVDGGSGDATVEIAQRMGAELAVAPRGRGRQMNHGARRTRGSLLVFLPGDTVLPAGALATLERVARSGHPRAGGFHTRLDSPLLVLRAVSSLHSRRARLTGVVYGDQVPFIRRELFEELGGYREDVDMEDVELGRRLARLVRPRLLPDTVSTSARRFESAGAWRATAAAAFILASRALLRRTPRSRTFFTPVR